MIMEEEYEVERVLDCLTLPSGLSLYYVKWKNYDNEYNTWEPVSNLNCPHRIAHFIKNGPDKIRTEYEKMKLYLSQHSENDIQAILKKYRNKKGHITEIPAPDSAEIDKVVKRFMNTDIESASDLKHAWQLLLHQFVFEKRQNQLAELANTVAVYNSVSPGAAPITIENNVDFQVLPENFTYIYKSLPREGVVYVEEPVIWCNCRNNCTHRWDECCGELNYSDAAYHQKTKRLKLDKGVPIYECNQKCSCDETCANKVVQKGIQVPLKIFKTDDGRGWGVKTLDRIRAGTFVCEYVGEILRHENATDIDQTYIFGLDFNATEDKTPDYVVDAKHYGNISHFINHSCDPNLEVFAVYINNLNPDLHHIALFAKRNISKNEELSFCYADQTKRKQKKGRNPCYCNSQSCKGYFYLN